MIEIVVKQIDDEIFTAVILVPLLANGIDIKGMNNSTPALKDLD